MATVEQIRAWLLLVEQARVAVNVARSAEVNPDVAASWDLSRAEDYLVNAFEEGLTLHGKAILRDHLDKDTSSVA